MLRRVKRLAGLAGYLARRDPGRLLELVNRAQFNDFKFLSAGRRRNFYLVTDFAIEKRTAYRRSRRNLTFFDVGFFTADQAIFDANVSLRVNNDNSGAVAG